MGQQQYHNNKPHQVRPQQQVPPKIVNEQVNVAEEVVRSPIVDTTVSDESDAPEEVSLQEQVVHEVTSLFVAVAGGAITSSESVRKLHYFWNYVLTTPEKEYLCMEESNDNLENILLRLKSFIEVLYMEAPMLRANFLNSVR